MHVQRRQEDTSKDMETIEALYKAAVGKTFTGSFISNHKIHEKEWAVVEITDNAAGLIKDLDKIYDEVGEGQIWRGFIRSIQKNYQLYVDQSTDTSGESFKIIYVDGPFTVESKRYTKQKGFCFVIAPAD